MSLPPLENEYNREILKAIASGHPFSQRSLSGDLGVALGLTNLLIRRLVNKGCVWMAGMGTPHVRYLMTATGWEALARVTRLSLQNTVHPYTETREQIRTSLSAVTAECEPDATGQKPVVFYGAEDVAEIAFVSLQGTDLRLVGVVDDRRRGRFFDLEIHDPGQLTDGTCGSIPYSHVVVPSIRHADAIRARLDALGVLRSRVSCL